MENQLILAHSDQYNLNDRTERLKLIYIGRQGRLTFSKVYKNSVLEVKN